MNFELNQLLIIGNRYADLYKYTQIVGQVVEYKKYHRDVRGMHMHLVRVKGKDSEGRWMVAEEDLIDINMTNEQAIILLTKGDI